MRSTLISILFFVSFSSLANTTTCYKISLTEEGLDKSSDLLCITPEDDGIQNVVELINGVRTIGKFDMTLVSRLRCFDCNQDRFSPSGIAEESNLKVFSVNFDGKMEDIYSMKEKGKVDIGATTFFYKSN